jgi:plasmid maintenance system antidote protein VapI
MVPTHNRTITQKDKVISGKLLKLWNNKKDHLELSQEKMAEKLGITQSAFSQMLHARMVITTDQIIKMALIFKESPTLIDPTFFTRFDIQNKNDLKAFLALEIAKLTDKEKGDLLNDSRTPNAKRKTTKN